MYRGQLISTAEGHSRSPRQQRERERERERERRALSYVIFTPLVSSSTSHLPIFSCALANSLPPLSLPICRAYYDHAPLVGLCLVQRAFTHPLSRLSPYSFHPEPAFLRRSCGLRATYRRVTIAGASFCLSRDKYHRSLRRRLHPRATVYPRV